MVCLGSQDGVRPPALPHPLCLTFAPLCAGVSLRLDFQATLLMLQELESWRAKCWALEVQRRFLCEPFPSPLQPLQPLVCPPVPLPSRAGRSHPEELYGAGLEGGLTSRQWSVWGGSGQSGKRFEMGLKVRNHSGLGLPPHFPGGNLGVWKVVRVELSMPFVGEKEGQRWKAR